MDSGIDSDADADADMPSLSTYLSHVRRLVFRPKRASSTGGTNASGSGNEQLILVMGNPSADLDSFVSAVVLSYFYNFHSNSRIAHSTGSSSAPPGNEHGTKTTERYVPVLNLPSVKAHELWRLRPEFGVAMRCALGESASEVRNESERDACTQGKGAVIDKVTQLEDLITIADVKSDPESIFHSLFSDSDKARELRASEQRPVEDSSNITPTTTGDPLPLFLVDHNAPSIPGLSDESIHSRFTVVGCIDHHADEGYVAQDASPRIITTGIGSCTSLVVKHLIDRGMWPRPCMKGGHDRDSSSGGSGNPSTTMHGAGSSIQEISRLALAPILIDTSNLKGKGDKCSDIDREAVAFLESGLTPARRNSTTNAKAESSSDSGVHPPASSDNAYTAWDRDAFYHAIANTKANSLNLLTMQETFDRDYKVWREPVESISSPESSTASTSEPEQVGVNIGMSSLVKPLSWLVKHAGGVDKFVQEVQAFATAQDRNLGVFGMLTRAGQGKEVVVLVLDESLNRLRLIPQFQETAGELKLNDWNEDAALMDAFDKSLSCRNGRCKIWWMGDTSKSRKQVGPLLREAVRNV
ncbi:hypothetical protein A1O3_00652 [Capronia epimyces CBS 606.96]|uniref:DHHA2 domain-containing protein n=1 Tax=Capronia epimyces CBS 606.96 TaxID=1182542 RepID=W9YGS6_9EURO|nr:uncharacterized protein A1O3_00652 [Capronia epimyces CBS 606.96]EXJ92102.1 hypothetical protein A1O3_00652 [Capronia epimyces CBS 606.96]